jgi:hypothetical protein
MRAKNAPKVKDWTLPWLKERVKYGHHVSLTKYLMHRDPGQVVEADLAGLTVEQILVQGFSVENGHVAVPQAAIKVYRNVPLTPLAPVAALCRASSERGRHLNELAKAILRKVPREEMDEDMTSVIGEAAVRHVMES